MNALCSPRSQFICRLAMLNTQIIVVFRFKTVSWCELCEMHGQTRKINQRNINVIHYTIVTKARIFLCITLSAKTNHRAIRIYLFCAYLFLLNVFYSQHFVFFFHSTHLTFIVESKTTDDGVFVVQTHSMELMRNKLKKKTE